MTRNKIIRLIFHKETIALIGSLVLLWFAINLLVDRNYNFYNLTKHSGHVIKIDSITIKVKDKPLFKEITKELRLTLDTENKYFTSITTNDFGYITKQISVGDYVNIFTKKKLWGFFGMKKSNDISHMTKNNLVIIDFSKYQHSISGLFIIMLIASISLFLFYYLRLKRRYNFS